MGLRTDTIKGVIWAGLGTVGSGIIGFLITIILARFLTPEDFGLIEVILSFVVVSEVLVDCGLSKAIIRDKEISQIDLSTVFYLNTIIAALLYAVIFVSAPFIADFYSTNQEFVILLRVLSLKILLDAISFTQIALCNRNMRFRGLSIITVISMFLSSLVSLAFIYCGLGIWALVAYYLMLSFFKTLLVNIWMRWRPTLAFDARKAKDFIGFGGPLMVVQVIDKLVSSGESLVVGKVYSKSDLGYFSQARKFDALVIQTLLGIVQKVTYPALSKTKTEEQLTIGYRGVMQVCLWAIMPVACFTFLNAETFMCTIFGPQWGASAEYLRLFSIFSLIFPLHSICFNIFLVVGETKQLMYISILKQCIRIVVILVTIKIGLYYFTVGIVAVMFLTSMVYIYYGSKLIHLPIKFLLTDNINTGICSILSVGLAKFISSMIGFDGLVEFLVIFVLSILLYWLLNMLLKNNAYKLIIQILKNSIK